MNARMALGFVLVLIGLLGITIISSLNVTGGLSYHHDHMMGGWQAPPNIGESSITIDQVEYLVKQYVNSLNYPDLELKEIMEFEQNYYIIVSEETTGRGAFELLVWKEGANRGQVRLEPGPNMMWNTKYGGMMDHMGQGMMGNGIMGGGMMGNGVMGQQQFTGEIQIGEDEAKIIGQQYLDRTFPGATIEESTQFYGYYTFDFEKYGEIQGMFSVNGYSGQIWYHGWHGTFIGMQEYGDEHED